MFRKIMQVARNIINMCLWRAIPDSGWSAQFLNVLSGEFSTN